MAINNSLNLIAGSGITFSYTAQGLTIAAMTGGDVIGPASATDNALARFDSTTGKLLQNSVGILDDTGNLSGLLSAVIGNTTIRNIVGGVNFLSNGDMTLTSTNYIFFESGGSYFFNSGNVNIGNGFSLRLTNASGSNYFDVKASPNATANTILQFPVAPPTAANQVFTGNLVGGTVVTSWANPATGSGDVVGPTSATDNALARFDSTTGKLIQNSNATLDDDGTLNLAAGIVSAGSSHIHGNLQIANNGILYFGTTGAATLTYPKDGGAAGSVMTDDGAGNLSLQPLPAVSGNVAGPASATDNAITRFDSTTGKLIQNSVAILDDAGHLSGLTGLVSSGLTYPTADADAGYVMKTDGLGSLSLQPDSSGSGNVVGPASATNNALVKFDSTTGKLVKNSSVILDDSGNLAGLLSAAFGSNFTMNYVSSEFMLKTSGITGINLTSGSAIILASSTGVRLGGSVFVDSDAVTNASNYLGWQNSNGGLFGIRMPAGPSATTVFEWPTATPTPGQALTAGAISGGLYPLSWTTPSIGNVVGPASANADSLVRFDSSTGKLIKDSLVLLDNVGNLAFLTSIAFQTNGKTTTLTGSASATANSHYEWPPAGPTVNGQVLSANTAGIMSWIANGDVVGPTSATDNALARFDSTTGKLIQNSLALLDDSANLAGLASISVAGVDIYPSSAGVVTFSYTGNMIISGTGTTTFSCPSVSINGQASFNDTVFFTASTVYTSNLKTTTFIGSPSATASATYQWPAAGPSANGQVLTCSTAGVMSWGVGTQLFLPYISTPATPTGGGILFVGLDGSLMFIGSNGTITAIAPP